MNKVSIRELVVKDCKGVTPQYVKKSKTIILNQRCVREFQIDYSCAKYISDNQKVSKEKYVKLGDVLINSTGQGTAGRCAIITYIPEGFNVTVDTHMIIIRCENEENAYCMAYNLYSNERYVMGLLTGSSGQAELDRVRLYNVNVPIPRSIKIKEKIKKIICNIENRIEVNMELLKYNDQLIKTVFNYWFLQLEFPNENGKAYLANGGKTKKIDGKIIPENWKYEKLEKYIDSNRGISYEDKNLVDIGIPMINLNSFNIDSSYKVEGIKYYEGEYTEDKKLYPYDLVMCNTQQTDIDKSKDIIGKTFLIPDIFDSEVVSSHHVTTVKVKTQELKVYLNCLFNTEFFHQYIVGFANGTSIRGLDFDGVLNYRTCIPDKEILSKFYNIAMAVEKKKSQIYADNEKLKKIRDTIIPLLLMKKEI